MRVTKSRSMGWSTSERTQIRWCPYSYTNGIYEVWIKGDMVAKTTDRWMAQAIVDALMTPAKKREKKT